MIRIKEGYSLRNVLDIYLIIGTGSESYQPNVIMSVNETGAFLWDILKEGSEQEQLIEKLVAEYEVELPEARKDVDLFLNQLQEKELILSC